MHTVAVVAFDGVVPFDLATPCEVFGRTRSATGAPAYRVEVCGESREVDAGVFRMRPRFGLGRLSRADTIVVPGVADTSGPVSPRLVRALLAAKARGARIASICTGAFVLAAAGVLDGQRATTHWLAAPELAARYPTVRVDADVLYVDGGQVLTAAGAAAGLDLCLHLVRRDHGAQVAASAARMAVMPLERAGGQAQFIVHEAPVDDGGSLEPILRWMEERSPGRRQRTDVQPALSRANRHHAASVVAPGAGTPGPAPPREHRLERRHHRSAGRLRLHRRAATPFPAHRGDPSERLPTRLPGGLSQLSGAC